MAHHREDEAETIVQQLEVNGSDDFSNPTTEKKERVHHRLGISLFVAIVAVSATIICQYTFTSWVPTLLVKRGINVSGSLGLSTLMELGAPTGCAIGAYLVDRSQVRQRNVGD